MSTAEEVARLIAFLASDAASSMTGSLTSVEGGILTTTASSKDEIVVKE